MSASTAAAAASRRSALSLYSHILRLHRQKLPFEMRQLGDTYVRCAAGRAGQFARLCPCRLPAPSSAPRF